MGHGHDEEEDSPPLIVPTATPRARHAIKDQDDLWREFLAMAGAVVESLDKGVEALCDGRLEVLREVKDAEEQSDREEVRIERECLRILALYEPVASDLRRLATIMKVSRDYERIADLAARLARRSRKLARKSQNLDVPEPLRSLALEVLSRVRDTYAALTTRDARRARTIIDGDRSIDRQYRRLRKMLKERLQLDTTRLHAWLQFLGAARNLERIADHTADIAQMIVFLEEGIFIRHKTESPHPFD